MNLKMINGDWDRHAPALPPLHHRKTGSPEASPVFWAKMRLSNWFASHITGQQGGTGEGGGVKMKHVKRSDGGGGGEWEMGQGI